MAFQAVNELEHFNFEDCTISMLRVQPDQINIEVEALIVKRNNSQNTNYTDSYAATTQIGLKQGKIIGAIKDGYRYYDANDVLQQEVPDTKLNTMETEKLLKECSGAYLYELQADKQEDGTYRGTIAIEFVDEAEQTMADSYRLEVTFEKSVVSWERYMNRVQN